ncbi:MAG: pyridoxamine 5'-phosphate oxidase family protein [Azoarcus sp.]|jgi:nitroimidazol reductase NimA-like FMN-containing flavoprotein (pyridoxamine 5'-phosphate oxidase superfamily)|nr:pyridoxamine 5'-phosphate oxidase family protein [Azoarcus sp.]
MPPEHAHPHGPMRRKQREITDRAEIDGIIGQANIMRIALVDGDVPFLVPVFYWYNGKALYFHSARSGTKIDILKRNAKVCFELGIEHGVIEDEMACDFEARHKTVIGIGKAVFVEDDKEKIAALDGIVARFTDRHFEYPRENLDRTAVIRIDIDSIKGKKYGFA